MAMEVDVVLDRAGDLRAARLLSAFAGLLPARLAERDVAFVNGDIAAMANGDIDLAALLLGTALVLPRVEVLPGLKHDHVGPVLLPEGGSLRLDGGILRRPECVGGGEIAVLAEQVCHQLTLKGCKVEDGGFGRDGIAAKQPRLQRGPAGRVRAWVDEHRQPFLLLGLARER